MSETRTIKFAVFGIVLFAFNGILLKNVGDALVDLLRNELGVRDRVGAGRPLQYVPCRATKNNSVCFAIKEIYQQRPRRHVPQC